MDDLSIKTNPVAEAVAAKNGSNNKSNALAGLAGSFRNLLNKAGIHVDDGYSTLANHSSASAAIERSDRPLSDDDYGQDQADDGQDRIDNGARNDDNDNNKSDTHRIDRDNEYGRDHGSDHREDRGGVRDSDHGENHSNDSSGEQDDQAAPQETSGNDEQGDDQEAASDDGETGNGDDTSSNSEGDTRTAGDETTGQETGTQNGEANTQTTGPVVSTEETDSVLNGLLAGNGVSAEGQASEQGKVSSGEGIAKAMANVSSTATEKVADAGLQNMAAKAVENLSKVTPGTGDKEKGPQDNHQSQGQANASIQAKSVANVRSAIVEEAGSGQTATTTQSQAAGLAKAIGDGNRAQVNVSVTNEAETLTSKPGQTLTASAVLNTEGNGSSATGQNTNTHNQGTGAQNTAAQAQQVQAAAAQNQGTQNSGTQAVQGADSKGLVQAQAVTSTAGSANHSGGEGTVQTASATSTANQQTQQAQSQSAANQANNAPKTFGTGHSAVEQVSVKITKAIQAGIDKINIQLRPANMGRVEVKMELTSDNRLMAVITADSKDTMELLKNDSRDLQRALQEAGLQTDAGDLSFNLRGQEGQEGEGNGNHANVQPEDEEFADIDTPIVEDAVIASDGSIISNGRVDVRA